MRLQVFFWTILFSSLSFILSLKILEVFSFIKYSPIGWAKYWYIFSGSHALVKWFILWVFLLIIIAMLFGLGQLVKKLRMDFVALLLSILIVWWIEWSVQKTIYIHTFSVPLAVVIAIHLLWILETASYHAKIKNLDTRNKLPDSSNVLK